jgi:hypothetical protein
MKLLRLAGLFIFCFFKSFLFCSANHSDANQYFKCSIAKVFDNKFIKQPFKIFLVMKHPHSSDQFRYLTSEEFVDYRRKLDNINERMKKLSWYDLKETNDINRIKKSFENLHYLILLDNGLPVVLATYSAYIEMAREIFLKKIEACQSEKDRKNDL